MLPNFKLAAILAALPALTAASPTSAGARRQAGEDGPFLSKRIINGTNAASGEFPYMISLIKDGGHLCGGVLLDARTVLTAANCSRFVNRRIHSIRAGSLDRDSGGTVVGVIGVVTHPGLNGLDVDVALWYLETPLEASSTIGYAVLPAQGSDPVVGALTTVAGWGRTATKETSTTLQKVEIPVSDRAACAAVYAEDPDVSGVFETDFCASLPEGGKGACGDDIGGPAVDTASGTLIGLWSWSVGCTVPTLPGVFARVGLVVDWINQNRFENRFKNGSGSGI
ncbi:trypsin [Microdochium nivale]|nr:trypsin [Microdochium nivale]